MVYGRPSGLGRLKVLASTFFYCQTALTRTAVLCDIATCVLPVHFAPLLDSRCQHGVEDMPPYEGTLMEQRVRDDSRRLIDTGSSDKERCRLLLIGSAKSEAHTVLPGDKQVPCAY